MGLFERLGRNVEKLKQQAEAASEQSATHGCENCETLLYTDHDECPECGADAVRVLSAE